QTNKVPRIGWIILGSPAGTHPDIFSYYDSFRAGLSDLGYVEGANLTISAKDAEGVPERLLTFFFNQYRCSSDQPLDCLSLLSRWWSLSGKCGRKHHSQHNRRENAT
ncbi:MAG: hypothetical protein WCD52_22765, partial [Xanthobacteraceae bacterium]